MENIISTARSQRASGDFDAFVQLCKDHAVPEDTQDQFWNGLRDDLDFAAVGSAAEKIEKEIKDFKGGQKEKAVSSHVARTLKAFCKNPQFAEAVVASKKTLSACCQEIMKGVGSSISDIEVYRRAAKFYFPGAAVRFNMQIEINGDVTAADAPAAAPKPSAPRKKAAAAKKPDVIQVSLFDL